MISSLMIEPIASPAGEDMEALLRLYEEAIPASERKPPHLLREAVHSPDHVLMAARRHGHVAGFFLLFIGPGMSLLEYLAVDVTERGGGIGAALYRAAREAAAPRPMLVEVESDRDEGSDQPLRRRRLDFYRRLGCRRVTRLDYVLPLRSGGAPPRIDILVDGHEGDMLPRRLLAGWLRDIYVRVYDCAEDDPRLLRTLTALTATISLE